MELFENSEVVELSLYGENEAGKVGSVKQAVLSLDGQEIMCIDSLVEHEFGFTPAISLYVACSDEEQMTRWYERLAEGGQVLMPLEKYDFSRKFGWVQDRFGVSWQLNLSGGSDSQGGMCQRQ